MKKKLFNFFVILGLSVLITFFIKTKFDIELSEMFFLTDNTLFQGLVIGIAVFVFLSLGKVFLRFIKTNFRR